MSFKRISFFGLPLHVGGNANDVCSLVREKNPASFITFAEPDAWHLAKTNPDYLAVLNQMSLVIPEGQGVALACHFFTRENCRAMSFDMTSIARPFFEMVVESKTTVALVGGQPRDDEDVQDKLKKYFPGIDIVSTTHGFGDFAPKINTIISKSPKVVIASIGAPRQEAFLAALKAAGYKGVAIACGDFFEHYLTPADFQEYPAWVGQFGLMPLYRILKHPQRLWRRYVFQYYYFVFLVIKGLIGMLTEKREAVASPSAKK